MKISHISIVVLGLMMSMQLPFTGCGGSSSTTATSSPPPSEPPSSSEPIDGDKDGVTVTEGDCDDTNAAINPNATEVCDGKDNNCNSQIDEGVTMATFYADSDGDGFGNSATATQACGVSAGYVADSTDCNDTDAAINSNATEVCDGQDNNCNSQVDEGVQATFYADSDGDGFGNLAATTQACEIPAGYAVDSTDCNDTSATVYPGANDFLGDGVDGDCNSFGEFLSPLIADELIATVAGIGTAGYSGDNELATQAQVSTPMSVAVDDDGNLYVIDNGNLRIRKISASGIITTIAGTGVSGDAESEVSAVTSPIAGAAPERLNDIAVDQNGNIFFTDSRFGKVRKISGGILTTVAGGGVSTSDDVAATSALLNTPQGIAIDRNGAIYVVETDAHKVRKFTVGGNIVTIAGTGTNGYSGDGGLATGALLAEPFGVAVDSTGNVFIADTNNAVIRKIAADGTISTIAGTQISESSGDGGPATEAQVTAYVVDLAVDSGDNLYLLDSRATVVRKIDGAGNILTVAGTGVSGYNGDDQLATSSMLNTFKITKSASGHFGGIALDPHGDLYIADSFNNRIRRVTP